MSQLDDLSKTIQNIVKIVTVLLGLLPTAAVLLGIIDIPPSLHQLLTFIVAVLGLSAAILLLVMTKTLDRLTDRQTFAIFGLATLLGCVLAVAYYAFAHGHIAMQFDDAVILPLQYSPQLGDIINNGYGGDVQQALNSPAGATVRRLIEQDNGGATLIFIALMGLAECLLVFGIFGAVLKLALQNLAGSASGNNSGPK